MEWPIGIFSHPPKKRTRTPRVCTFRRDCEVVSAIMFLMHALYLVWVHARLTFYWPLLASFRHPCEMVFPLIFAAHDLYVVPTGSRTLRSAERNSRAGSQRSRCASHCFASHCFLFVFYANDHDPQRGFTLSKLNLWVKEKQYSKRPPVRLLEALTSW